MTTDAIRAFRQAYLDTLPPDDPARAEPIPADDFGDSPELADELLALVLTGQKTATCSSLWEWEAEGETPPTVDSKAIFLDGAGAPRCVAETVEVRVLPMDQVDAAFARDEGEGDLTLDYWRAAHASYFTRTLPRIGRAFAPDMPLVCERFRVVYQPRS